MIKKLNHSKEDVAQQIFTVFQSSYKVEAQVLGVGVTDFPPLARRADDIQNSKSSFYGFLDNGSLASVIEIVVKDNRLSIESLTVDPAYFRKGIANQLLATILQRDDYSDAVVETGFGNLPAISLYKKHGFVEFKSWTPSHGIKKIALSLEKSL